MLREEQKEQNQMLREVQQQYDNWVEGATGVCREDDSV